MSHTQVSGFTTHARCDDPPCTAQLCAHACSAARDAGQHKGRTVAFTVRQCVRAGRNDNIPPPARQRDPWAGSMAHTWMHTTHTHTHTHAHTHTHCTHIIYSRPHTHDAQSKQLARKVHLREASAELWGSQRAAGTAEVGADEIEGSAGRSPDITKPASHFSGAGDSAERARTCGRMTPVAPKLPIATRSGSRSLSAGRR